MIFLDDVLSSHGYKLIDDAWQENGRRTYHHNDEATRKFITGLTNGLRIHGWVSHPEMLRAFRLTVTDETIEIEPSGADTSGHLLHHMKKPD